MATAMQDLIHLALDHFLLYLVTSDYLQPSAQVAAVAAVDQVLEMQLACSSITAVSVAQAAQLMETMAAVMVETLNKILLLMAQLVDQVFLVMVVAVAVVVLSKAASLVAQAAQVHLVAAQSYIYTLDKVE
jgi:hypothetical protein